MAGSPEWPIWPLRIRQATSDHMRYAICHTPYAIRAGNRRLQQRFPACENQGERKRAMKSRRGSAHAELLLPKVLPWRTDSPSVIPAIFKRESIGRVRAPSAPPGCRLRTAGMTDRPSSALGCGHRPALGLSKHGAGFFSHLLESGGSMRGSPRSGSSPLRWGLNSSSGCGSAVLQPDRIPAVGAYGPDHKFRNAPLRKQSATDVALSALV